MLKFFKYQATGNDFILLTEGNFPVPFYAFLCDRHLGIGADGILIPRFYEDGVPYMEYRNSDGKISSFCGNGSRAFVKFLSETHKKNIWEFQAKDGKHKGEIVGNDKVRVSLNVFSETLKKYSDTEYFIDSGSPHYIVFVKEDVAAFSEFVTFSRKIRYDASRFPNGTNVNIVSILSEGKLQMRTYERGVEAETLSCGTGTVAVAWIYHFLFHRNTPVKIITLGGELTVTFPRKNLAWLEGPAHKVFEGFLDLDNLTRQMKETNYVMLERKMQ